MPFPITGVLDNFSRADEGPPPSASWTNFVDSDHGGGLKVSGLEAMASVNGDSSSYWNTNFGPDCEAYVRLNNNGDGTWNLVYARLTGEGTATPDGYCVEQKKNAGASNDTVKLFRVDNGVHTQIGSTYTTEWVANDQVGIECVGSTIKAYYKTVTGSWTEVISTTDATYSAAGKIGLYTRGNQADLDDFGGGTIPGGSIVGSTPLLSAPAFGTGGSLASAGTITGTTSLGSSSAFGTGGRLLVPGVDVFPTTGVLDNFNRADEAPLSGGGNWSGPAFAGAPGAPRIVSNQVAGESGATGLSSRYWSAATFGPDVEAFVTLSTLLGGSNRVAYAIARLTNPGGSSACGYVAHYQEPTGAPALFRFLRVDNGVGTVIGATVQDTTPAAGDSFGLSVVGNVLKFYYKPVGGAWSERNSVIDTTYTSPGYIGFSSHHTSARVDDFGGGTSVLSGGGAGLGWGDAWGTIPWGGAPGEEPPVGLHIIGATPLTSSPAFGTTGTVIPFVPGAPVNLVGTISLESPSAFGTLGKVSAQSPAGTIHPIFLIFQGGAPAAATLDITTTALGPGQVGTAYSQPLAATGGTPPYTWSLAFSSTLPPGLSLSAGGVISGTPTTPVGLSFFARVTDAVGAIDTQSLTILVSGAPATLNVTTITLGDAAQGVFYSRTLAATGGTPPYTWSVFSGSLPAGLSLSAAGVISGTPSTPGSSSFTVRATDAVAAVDNQLLSIVVTTVAPPAPQQTFPQVFVEMALTSSPQAAVQLWSDFSAKTRALETSRGKDQELGRVDAGEISLVLDNRDRSLDPENVASPYYPLKPLRRVRIRARHSGVDFGIATGYIEGYPQEWGPPNDALVKIVATDAFKILNLFDLAGTAFPEQYSGERIQGVLLAVGFSASDMTIDRGQSIVTAIETLPEGSFALEHCLAVAESDSGNFFVNRNGLLVFHDRHHRVKNESQSRALFGDASNELPYTDLETDHSDADIFNECRLTLPGGDVITFVDQPSVDDYYKRSLSLSLVLADANDALSKAQYVVGRFKDPVLRVPGMEMKGMSDPLLWTPILSSDLGSRIRVKRRPPGGGAPIDVGSHVESISHSIRPGKSWATRWALSEADPQSYWILGIPGFSELGITTRLYY